MKKNLFDNAKFGDKFLTRDGNIMLFLMDDATKTNQYYMVGKKGKTEWYDKNGAVINHPDYGNNNIDIVSRYQEPIDEDKLNCIAEYFYPKTMEYIDYQYGCEDTNNPLRKAFKTGYRKAKEQ